MSTSTHPWFHIVGTLEAIQKGCLEAQEAEKRARQAKKTREVDSKTPGLTPPRAVSETGTNIVMLRKELRDQLSNLEKNLSESLTEPEKFHALFPLTIFADELARSAVSDRIEEWPSLQRELLDFDNGGMRFYTHIDALLKKPEPMPLVFQVFYLCLEAGFEGQHRDNPAERAEYKKKLKNRIPQELPAKGDDGKSQAPTLVGFPTKYYAWAAAAMAGGYLLLRLTGIVEALSAG